MYSTILHSELQNQNSSFHSEAFIKKIQSYFFVQKKQTPRIQALGKELQEVLITQQPTALLHFWYRIDLQKKLLESKIENSKNTQLFQKCLDDTIHVDRNVLAHINTELQLFFVRYIQYFQDTRNNISFLRSAFQSKNRAQVVRMQHILEVTKIILGYISKPQKTSNDWRMIIDSMTDFFTQVEAYRNNTKTPVAHNKITTIQNHVQHLLYDTEPAYIPGKSPQSIPPEKKDRFVTNEILLARSQNDTDTLAKLAQYMIQRLEYNEFPPSTHARAQHDFHSSALGDHIHHITPDNPVLMDTLEWGPVEILNAIPYISENPGKYIATMIVRGKKARYVLDVASTFVGEVTSPKILGILNRDNHLQGIKDNYFTVKYFQFKYPDKIQPKQNIFPKKAIPHQDIPKTQSSVWKTIINILNPWREKHIRDTTPQ